MTKRRDLIKELHDAGFESKGGSNHETFADGRGHVTRVPYHREIRDELADAIRKQAGIKGRRK